MKRIGFYSAVFTSAITVVTFLIAVLTPPLSGPWCTSGCFEYPYLSIGSRFPRDYYWMFPALLLCISFIVLMASIHQYANQTKRVYSLSALVFAGISSAILFIDYFVQLSVVQPGLLKSETNGLSLITQYNPHGIFIALEELGYFMMSLALFCTIPAFAKNTRLEKAIRTTHFTGFMLTTLALIIISVLYGIHREYRFEVAAIAINFLSLIISGILLSRLFKGIKI